MQTATYYTAEEYLALDAEAEEGVRYEYWDGHVVAMAGAEPEHNVLKGNIAGELRDRLIKRGCRVMTSDQRVQVGSRHEAGWLLPIYSHRDAMLRSAHFDLEIPVEAFYALVLPE